MRLNVYFYRCISKGLHDPVNADVVKFHKQMDPHIRKLYPKVKKIHWMQNVVRGGHVGSHPKAFYAHIDYHPNNTERFRYHNADRPPFPTFLSIKHNEPMIMMGSMDTEEYKFEVMLGIWKALSKEVSLQIDFRINALTLIFFRFVTGP